MKPLQPTVRESLEDATTRFMGWFTGSPAETYVAGRGLLDAWVDFRLGYVAEPVPGFERFVGRLAIPNICASGHVVGMKFRALGDEDPKYDGLSLPSRLFNLRALNADTDVMCLTEGELDAVALGVLGVPAVAVPGKGGWKAHHHRILEQYRRIVLFRDVDGAGGELVARVTGTDLPVIVVTPPGGHKDVNDALVAGLGSELVDIVRGNSK